MFYWSGLFLLIGLIAAIFGFAGISVGLTGMARMLTVVFFGLFFFSLFHAAGGNHRFR